MNVCVKQNSSINPSITKSVFKGFLHQAHAICSEKYVHEETDFIIMPKRKTMTFTIKSAQRESHGYL